MVLWKPLGRLCYIKIIVRVSDCVNHIFVQGSQKTSDALDALNTFEAKLNKVREDRENMIKAKGALEMAEPLASGAHSAKLDVAIEELSDLKGETFWF